MVEYCVTRKKTAANLNAHALVGMARGVDKHNRQITPIQLPANILNNHIALGHDVTLGNYNSLMIGTKICGACNIGDRNYFGVNSTVLQTFSVGNDTMVGTGSVIMKNTRDDSTYFGNPARSIIAKK